MNWYNDKKELWKDIIDAVSLELKRNTLMVEKDIIQSMFLYELSKCNLPFVFKGGTSLSKAYNLIDRFSEDIDLSMSREITTSEKRRTKEVILNIASTLGLCLINGEDVLSRHNYNKYIFKYNSLYDKDMLEMIVESSFYQMSYPTERKVITTYVGKFCDDKKIVFPIKFDGIKFEMNVQSLERTFIDKVFAVCDYKIENMMDRYLRHLYDIAKILPMIELNDNFKSLFNKVRMDRIKNTNNPSANMKYNINSLLKEIISSRFYENDYKTITQKLLYENIRYDDAIANGITKLVDHGIID